MTEFTKYEQIAGFVGYELGDITAVGAYRYKCDSAPPPEPTDPKDDQDDIKVDCEDLGMETDYNTGVCYYIDRRPADECDKFD